MTTTTIVTGATKIEDVLAFAGCVQPVGVRTLFARWAFQPRGRWSWVKPGEQPIAISLALGWGGDAIHRRVNLLSAPGTPGRSLDLTALRAKWDELLRLDAVRKQQRATAEAAAADRRLKRATADEALRRLRADLGLGEAHLALRDHVDPVTDPRPFALHLAVNGVEAAALYRLLNQMREEKP